MTFVLIQNSFYKFKRNNINFMQTHEYLDVDYKLFTQLYMLIQFRPKTNLFIIFTMHMISATDMTEQTLVNYFFVPRLILGII